MPVLLCLIIRNKQGYFDRNFATIFLLHFSGSFSMSCSHSLRTDHPSRLSFRLYLLSRLMLFSILSRQNFFGSLFFCPYLYPCQKSPSQNIAIFFLLCAKSGFPYIFGCISNLYPVSASICFIFNSIFVFLPLILDMTHDLFSGVNMSVMDNTYGFVSTISLSNVFILLFQLYRVQILFLIEENYHQYHISQIFFSKNKT